MVQVGFGGPTRVMTGSTSTSTESSDTLYTEQGYEKKRKKQVLLTRCLFLHHTPKIVGVVRLVLLWTLIVPFLCSLFMYVTPLLLCNTNS